MDRAELIRIAREDYLDDVVDLEDADDAEAIYRWKTTFLLRSSAEAERQACRRRDLRHIYDDESTDCCVIALTAGQRSYSLSPVVLRIDQARHSGLALVHTTREALDACNSAWRDDADGTPTAFYVTGRKLVLDRAPDATAAAYPISLGVYREPFATEDVTLYDEFEWPGEIRPLVHWMCWEAYQRNDQDTINKGMAVEHLALFERAFGPALEQRSILGLLEQPGSVRYGQQTGYVDRWHDSPGCTLGRSTSNDW